jgi:GntR family transcriptional regulator
MSTRFVPRYYAIEQELRARIARLQPGDALPSDAMLCKEFGVSRMTARNAVQQLKLEGLVRRIPGRGTFVAPRPLHRRMGRLLSFSDEMRARGLAPSSRVLELGRAPASSIEAEALELAVGDDVVVVQRVRLADRVPVAIERVALPASCAAVLESDLERGSLHAALRALGRVPTVARGTLAARLAGRRDAELLEIRPRAPLLVERRVIADAEGASLEATETRYAGERYVFDVELHGDDAGE